MDLDRALSAAVRAAHEAGRLLREAQDVPRKTFKTKSNRHDLVTEFDRRAEAIIVDRLRRETPEHGILSEEGAQEDGSSGAVWVIDPLDGTSNFANGIPHFATSIGLIRGNESIVGCIYSIRCATNCSPPSSEAERTETALLYVSAANPRSTARSSASVSRSKPNVAP